ncbi:E3 ubiquitin-protein ligase synoviolin [Nematocida sp. AWRm77]|nr:E3 ubiquitin-protein ligase synoviolin [Nematocida sp. AWRm77]
MHRHTLYLGGYLAVLSSICISNYMSGKSLYHSLLGLVENRVQHFVLCSFFVFLVYLSAQLTVRVFIGKLTPLEVEGVQDYGVRYLGNICLIITLFADNITLRGLIVFSVVFGMKIVHWVVGLRIDTVEKNGEMLDSVIVKMYAMCGVLLCADFLLMVKSLRYAFVHPGVSILFGFEFSLVFAYAIRCIYAITVLSMVREKSIEERIFMMFYGDFVFGVFKIAAHVVCLVWTTVHFRMPINLLRESMYIIKHLTTRTRAVMMYRDILKELEACPDISGSALEENLTCLICHEEMETAKKLECSHMFHLDCLKEWLHRQQICPVCRKEFVVKGAPSSVREDAERTEGAEGAERSEEPRTQSGEGVSGGTGSRIYFQEANVEYEGFPVTLEEE